ncbi:MAG TPA: L,D-transpeptidase family protein [Chitinophagaceae bacterium]|nr:L,D-transpeptidase family protein [Chitinophagaceae bacterium]
MRKSLFVRHMVLPAALCWLLVSCHSGPPKTDVAKNVQSLNERVEKDIGTYVSFFESHKGKMPGEQGDTIEIHQYSAVGLFYANRHNRAAWSDTGRLLPQADSLLDIISGSEDDGLNPAWYHGPSLRTLTRQVKTDSTARRDAIKWSTVDILLTDAFMRLAGDLHYGLLPPDSISLQKGTAYSDSTVIGMLTGAIRHGNVRKTVDSLRPQGRQYRWLSRGMDAYRRKYAGRSWDTLPVKYSDTPVFRRQLAQRLVEGGALDSSAVHSAAAVTGALKAFQRSHGLYPDGVAGTRTVAALNLSKSYRLRQIAVNLERWRHVGDSLPQEYVWINIPSYRMEVWDHDSVVITSKVIVGKPGHETPLLNSRLTNYQLYPYWRVPISIIAKEMLPAIRRDTGYLRKHNLEVVDRHNNIVDPSRLQWNKYNRHYFPYVMRQMTGLDNSLGIIKFNFRNKYSVYLHDTNLRNLFNMAQRDISHGCVRVQRWDTLAMYLIRGDTLRHMRDSVLWWLATQQQKWVPLRTRVPVYTRYFTCAADSTGKITFYPDVYGYDTVMMHKMFRRTAEKYLPFASADR